MHGHGGKEWKGADLSRHMQELGMRDIGLSPEVTYYVQGSGVDLTISQEPLEDDLHPMIWTPKYGWFTCE
jgi:hypothetical protein